MLLRRPLLDVQLPRTIRYRQLPGGLAVALVALPWWCAGWPSSIQADLLVPELSLLFLDLQPLCSCIVECPLNFCYLYMFRYHGAQHSLERSYVGRVIGGVVSVALAEFPSLSVVSCE